MHYKKHLQKIKSIIQRNESESIWSHQSICEAYALPFTAPPPTPQPHPPNLRIELLSDSTATNVYYLIANETTSEHHENMCEKRKETTYSKYIIEFIAF